MLYRGLHSLYRGLQSLDCIRDSEVYMPAEMDIVVVVFLLAVFAPGTLCIKPQLDKAEETVTVTEGTTAVLPCEVKHLGNRKVMWTDSYSKLLTFEDRRVINHERISVERPFRKDWNLHIREVRYSDQGIYNCQINTNPVMMKSVHLIVQVPPKIIDHLSSTDFLIPENETVTLICNATGVPEPQVTWHRLESEQAEFNRKDDLCQHPELNDPQVGVSGEMLVIHNVSRHCGGVFRCTADNGVPPAASRQISVRAIYGPEVTLPNKRIGQIPGLDTILECTVTAFPDAIIHWVRHGTEVTSSQKYHLTKFHEGPNVNTLTLRIQGIEQHDYGKYTCVASNHVGQDSKSMILYDYWKCTTTTTTTTTRKPNTAIFTDRKSAWTSPAIVLPPSGGDKNGKTNRATVTGALICGLMLSSMLASRCLL